MLNRPKLRARHGLTCEEVDTLLIALAENAIVLEPVNGPATPEPGDQHLWDLPACHDDLCLITGDALLLHAPRAPAPVLSPGGFAAELRD